MESLIQQDKYWNYCLICGRPAVETHHVEGRSNRPIAEKEKLRIHLCMECHNSSKNSVHMNGKLKSMSHIAGQYAWMFKWVADNYSLPFDDGYEDMREQAIEAYRKKFGQSYV